MENLQDVILAENEFIWNYNPGQPRDALGRWAGVGADYTFIEKKALGLLSTEQIRSYVRGKYPGKPKVVDGDTFDNTDGIDIFRGVDNVAQAMDYVKSNKHFSTNEMQGITGHDFHEDFEVAKANRDAEAKIKRKYVVIQARLDTSRMTTYENLVQERNDYCPEQDLTTFAVDKGYSAVKIQNGTVVVLDKTATTVFDGSLREYDDETFNNRENNMDRLERLNNIIDRLDNFNPYHDKLGRFTTGTGGAAGGAGGGETKSPSADDAASTGKVKMKDSTCGIPGDMGGDEIKSIPRLKGLNKKQKQIESEAISHWEDPKERERLVNSLVATAEKKLAEGKDAIIETDAMKEELAKGWGKDNEYKPLSEKYSNYSKKIDLENKLNNFYNQPKEKQDLKELAKLNKDYEKVKNAKPLDKTEQARFDELRAFRAEYNSMLHQTANAVAKVAFEKLASRHQGEKMGITLGGCASGKGFGLEHPEMFQGTHKGKSLQEYTKGTKIWWDSAGEQGAAELNWFTRTAKKNKSKSITYINTETNASAAARNAGGRVAEKGRLVSFEAFYDSYVNTRTNFEKFAKANNRDASLNIITVKNMGKGSKEPLTIMKSGSKLSEFPSKAEMKSIYESAIKNSGLPKSVEDAAMTGFSFTFKLN